jgi:hypothetical protein
LNKNWFSDKKTKNLQKNCFHILKENTICEMNQNFIDSTFFENCVDKVIFNSDNNEINFFKNIKHCMK